MPYSYCDTNLKDKLTSYNGKYLFKFLDKK